MSQGIYKITNKVNGKCYIGKSSNIEERWKYHTQVFRGEKEYEKPLYRAFRKYGLNNFLFEIIEELQDYSKSNEREKYWIKYYNSYGIGGYNATIGGDGGITSEDPRAMFALVSVEDVIYIRKRYAEHKYPASYIYRCEFKDKITLRGFRAIWNCENAKNIMPEIYTEEDKKKNIKLERAYEGVLRRKISLEEKQKIKKRIENGEKLGVIWKLDYKDIYKSYTGFRDMVRAISLDEVIKLDGTIEPL